MLCLGAGEAATCPAAGADAAARGRRGSGRLVCVLCFRCCVQSLSCCERQTRDDAQVGTRRPSQRPRAGRHARQSAPATLLLRAAPAAATEDSTCWDGRARPENTTPLDARTQADRIPSSHSGCAAVLFQRGDGAAQIRQYERPARSGTPPGHPAPALRCKGRGGGEREARRAHRPHFWHWDDS